MAPPDNSVFYDAGMDDRGLNILLVATCADVRSHKTGGGQVPRRHVWAVRYDNGLHGVYIAGWRHWQNNNWLPIFPMRRKSPRSKVVCRLSRRLKQHFATVKLTENCAWAAMRPHSVIGGFVLASFGTKSEVPNPLSPTKFKPCSMSRGFRRRG